MEEINLKIEAMLNEILMMLDKEIERFEKVLKTTTDANKKAQIKKTVILYKALFKYYSNSFKDIEKNLQGELSHYLNIVDTSAGCERVIDQSEEIFDVKELLKDVTSQDLRNEIKDTFGKLAGSTVGEVSPGSNIPELQMISRVDEDGNLPEGEDITYEHSDESYDEMFIGSTVPEKKMESRINSEAIGSKVNSEKKMPKTKIQGSSKVSEKVFGSKVNSEHGSKVSEKVFGSTVNSERPTDPVVVEERITRIPRTKKVREELSSKISEVGSTLVNYVNNRIGSKTKNENIGSHIPETMFSSNVNSEASSRISEKELGSNVPDLDDWE